MNYQESERLRKLLSVVLSDGLPSKLVCGETYLRNKETREVWRVVNLGDCTIVDGRKKFVSCWTVENRKGDRLVIGNRQKAVALWEDPRVASQSPLLWVGENI